MFHEMHFQSDRAPAESSYVFKAHEFPYDAQAVMGFAT